MTKREQSDPEGDETSLRLDIYLHSATNDDAWPSLARLSEFAGARDQTAAPDDLVTLACNIYHSRRLRSKFFSSSMLGEPVWDMLLALYCFSARGEVLSVSGLCQAADVPQSTAIRWVQLMEQKQLVIRSKDRKDGRRAFVSLSDEAKQIIDNYLTSIRTERTG